MSRFHAVLLPLVPVALLCGLGCGRESKSSEPTAAASSSALIELAPPPAEPAPASEFHESTFDLSVQTGTAYVNGRLGSLQIVLTPKGGFHPNTDYPYKLKVRPAAGVTFPSEVVTKDAVVLEPTRATMRVDFTPQASGPHEIGGQFSFSLCSEKQCIKEKRDIVATIRVN